MKNWPKFAALLLGPLLVVGALIGLTSAKDETRIQAAVVNLDEAVTIDGQVVPLGRQLAAAMLEREGENVSWTLADAASGAAGLRTGEYSAVVTIPQGFSAAATSFAANDAAAARQATIQVSVSDNAPITDAALAQQVARIATESINSTLTSSYLDQVYVGFNTVGEQFVTVVDGANQLVDGTSQLADGVTEASQGAAQLSDGMAQLVDAGPALRDGGAQLASGVGQLDTAAGQLSAGAGALNSGVAQLAGSTPQLVSGVGQLATGGDQLLSGLPAYTEGAAAVVGGVGKVRDGLDQVLVGIDSAAGMDTGQLDQLAAGARAAADGVAPLAAGLEQVDGALAGYTSGAVAAPSAVSGAAAQVGQAFQCPVADEATCALLRQAFEQGAQAGAEAGFRVGTGAAHTMLNTDQGSGSLMTGARQLAGLEQLAVGVETLAEQLPQQTAAQLAQLRSGIAQARDGAATIAEQGQPLVDNASTIADGATQLNAGLQELNSKVGALDDGVAELATGSAQLASGVAQLDAGVGELNAGAAEYVAGVGQYVDGLDSAADGAQALTAGLVALDDGAAQLDSGVSRFASELAKGSDQVPSYSASDRETLATVVADPVAQGSELAKGSTVALTSLLLVAALWLGGLASFSFLRPVPRDVVTSSASSVSLWLRTVGLPAGIAAVQGVALGAVGWSVLGLSAGRGLGLIGLLAALGISFVLANHALAGWLGHAGRALAALLLAVTIGLAVSSTVGWLAPVGAVSPLHNGYELIRTWAAGGGGGIDLAGAAVGFGLLALVASVLAIGTRRRLTAAQYRAAG